MTRVEYKIHLHTMLDSDCWTQCHVLKMGPNLSGFVFILVGFIFILLTYIRYMPLPDLEECTVMPSASILVWLHPFGVWQPVPNCSSLVGTQSCSVTTNRDQYLAADAVVIHHNDIVGNAGHLLSMARPPGQKWIWMNYESPTHTHNLGQLNGLFNWTLTYKTGSDIFLPYGYLKHRHTSVPRGTIIIPNKSKLVAWVVSNWNENHDRVKFYHKLKKHIDVDIYGRNTRPLFNNSIQRTVSRYKFYLAFENSRHTDYITEKLWHNALESGTVPVVLGPSRSNYEKFLPANAFIHVDDFRKPRMLAAYLKFLDRNPRLYKRYFQWRRDYTVHVPRFWSEHYCSACVAVLASRNQSCIISDLSAWFTA